MKSGYISYQAAAFFAGFPRHANAAKLWSEIFDEPYGSFQTPVPQVSVASGRVGDLQVELHHQPDRYDVVTRMFDDQPGPPKTAAALEVLSAVAVDAVLRAATDATITRAASIGIWAESATSLIDANRKMAAAVPGLPTNDRFSDQMFQLNSPVSSKAQAGMVLNRLCRWNSVVGRSMVLHMGPDGPAPTLPLGDDISWALHTTVDVNCRPDARPDPALLGNLYGEFAEQIEAVIVRGYEALV